MSIVFILSDWAFQTLPETTGTIGYHRSMSIVPNGTWRICDAPYCLIVTIHHYYLHYWFQLLCSFSRAQAFQSAYSSFVSWLRDTERKIQRDNQLKLEVNDLKSGLAYLKVSYSIIHVHVYIYLSPLCWPFTFDPSRLYLVIFQLMRSCIMICVGGFIQYWI